MPQKIYLTSQIRRHTLFSEEKQMRWKKGTLSLIMLCVSGCQLCVVVRYIFFDRQQKSRQHPDFPGGHPPEYYPSLRLLNFADQTGYGVLSLRWPSTNGKAVEFTRWLLNCPVSGTKIANFRTFTTLNWPAWGSMVSESPFPTLSHGRGTG